MVMLAYGWDSKMVFKSPVIGQIDLKLSQQLASVPNALLSVIAAENYHVSHSLFACRFSQFLVIAKLLNKIFSGKIIFKYIYCWRGWGFRLLPLF
jgi:hypothetical protein